MSTECTHTLASGAKCQAPALNGSSFCHHHNPRQLPDPHPRDTSESEPLFLPPLLDKCSILVAVCEVIHAASERRIKCSEARTLLLGLKFASRLMTEIDQTGVSSSAFESQPYPQPAEQQSSPQPAAGENRNKLTPDELDEFTQRLQNSAVQQLRHQNEGSPRKRVAGIADQAVTALAASGDPRSGQMQRS
jgi:hypothetical protein